MKNPWLKKNPFMSMWLSGANAVAGAARARVGAEVKRQTQAASTAMVKEFFAPVTKPVKPLATPARKRKRV